MSFDYRYLTAGDCGLVVEFGDLIDEKINARVYLLAHLLTSMHFDGLWQIVPTYRSVLVLYDPFVVSKNKLVTIIDMKIATEKIFFEEAALPESSGTIQIPVCYGGELGPDLAHVAKHNNLSEQEVIDIHTRESYRVYMLGFLPGFPYLGGMDERIACPRLKIPRTVVPAGSVGIAGSQTGVYTVDSPGGWQLIGKTPLKIFAVEKERPFLINPGDNIIFKAIDEKTFAELAVAK